MTKYLIDYVLTGTAEVDAKDPEEARVRTTQVLKGIQEGLNAKESDSAWGIQVAEPKIGEPH